jgi:hypothetical protein
VKQQPTSLSQQCPAEPVGAYNGNFTVSGQLQPALAGAAIKVTYTTPDSTESFERSVTTDGNGAWTDTIDPRSVNQPYGAWKVQGRFEGDTGHSGSSAPECTVAVFNDG